MKEELIKPIQTIPTKLNPHAVLISCVLKLVPCGIRKYILFTQIPENALMPCK